MRRQAPVLYPQRVAAPAVGQEFVLRPTGQGGILVQSITFTLTTSAVVANRIPTLVLSDGTDTILRFQAPTALAASLVATWQAYDGAFPNAGAAGITTLGWPNQGLWIPQGYSLTSVTVGLDGAGDQYSGIIAFVQEFTSGPDYTAQPTELMHTEPLD
jgi:hypothetical protein